MESGRMSGKQRQNTVVLIIAYFGVLPGYFDLWLKSAQHNSEFEFFVYTDAGVSALADSNVKVVSTSFEDFRERFYRKLGRNIKLNTPYKLCDYRPSYGYVLEEDIGDFDFWGFCDIDLIFGDLGRFVTQDKLETYDKLYNLGHFCLMRNTEKMNRLFLEKYDRILDFGYVCSTNYACHFDENGTIAWADEYDNSVRVYRSWDFADPAIDSYKLNWGGGQCCAVWDNGSLKLIRPDGRKEDIMYIHLQKRKMKKRSESFDNAFLILRDEFCSCSADEITIPESDPDNEKFFNERRKKQRRKMIRENIFNGALRYRVNAALKHWKKY